MLDVDGEQLAGAEVVAVGETARNHEHGVIIEAQLAGGEAVDVDALRSGARKRTGAGGVVVAVNAGGAQDEDAYRHRGILFWIADFGFWVALFCILHFALIQFQRNSISTSPILMRSPWRRRWGRRAVISVPLRYVPLVLPRSVIV